MESKNRVKKRRKNTIEALNTHSIDIQTKRTISYNYIAPLVISIIVIVLFYLVTDLSNSTDDVSYPGNETIYNVTCQPEIHEVRHPACSPQDCARIVVREFLSTQQASQLVNLVKKALIHGRSDGGASIFDFHSGAISKGDKFINVYSIHTTTGGDPVFGSGEFEVLYRVIEMVHTRVAVYFGLDRDRLYLTNPTFFSEMTARPARTIHDEYWHTHIDKQTYEAFHYTSLIYLSDQDRDFKGGSFVYEDNRIEPGMRIHPSIGLLSVFTSGSENPHRVERVRDGVRYALTVGFTCDPDKKISL